MVTAIEWGLITALTGVSDVSAHGTDLGLG